MDLTSKYLVGKKAYLASSEKRLGKVRRVVFHPTEKRAIGITIHRPDLALMFHRKDIFVALYGFVVKEDGVHISGADDAQGAKACKKLGVNWDQCLYWVGMPLLSESGKFLGYVEDVAFNGETGAVDTVTAEEGATAALLLGKRTIPASMIKGFKRGVGVPLQGDSPEEDQQMMGAILVKDEALTVNLEGGAASAAAKASTKAKAVVDQKIEEAKPAVEKATKVAGEAATEGAFAVGKQLGRASGMFSAFKEEFQKAAKQDVSEGGKLSGGESSSDEKPR